MAKIPLFFNGALSCPVCVSVKVTHSVQSCHKSLSCHRYSCAPRIAFEEHSVLAEMVLKGFFPLNLATLSCVRFEPYATP